MHFQKIRALVITLDFLKSERKPADCIGSSIIPQQFQLLQSISAYFLEAHAAQHSLLRCECISSD
jgi:hypothetical protein